MNWHLCIRKNGSTPEYHHCIDCDMKKAQALMLECFELFILIFLIIHYIALDLIVSTPWAFHKAYDRANTAGLPIEHFS